MYTVFPRFGGRGCLVVWFVSEAIIVMPIIRYSIFFVLLTEVPTTKVSVGVVSTGCFRIDTSRS